MTPDELQVKLAERIRNGENVSDEEVIAVLSQKTEEEFEEFLRRMAAAGLDSSMAAAFRGSFERARGQAAALQRTGAKTVAELRTMMKAIGAKSLDELPAVPKP